MSPITIIRTVVAILLGIHGFSRAFTGGVHGLGNFLATQHMPYPQIAAWAITIFEMAGSICLLTNRFVRIAALGHAIILVTGIALVHAKNGWFVVGGGTNGVEYSVLLVACLVAILISNSPRLQR
ncbi:MAG: DoxX family protein [Myxococcales bacterium]|nr:DoxX family protein [Myxococcales bacterium]